MHFWKHHLSHVAAPFFDPVQKMMASLYAAENGLQRAGSTTHHAAGKAFVFKMRPLQGAVSVPITHWISELIFVLV